MAARYQGARFKVAESGLAALLHATGDCRSGRGVGALGWVQREAPPISSHAGHGPSIGCDAFSIRRTVLCVLVHTVRCLSVERGRGVALGPGGNGWVGLSDRLQNAAWFSYRLLDDWWHGMPVPSGRSPGHGSNPRRGPIMCVLLMPRPRPTPCLGCMHLSVPGFAHVGNKDVSVTLCTCTNSTSYMRQKSRFP